MTNKIITYCFYILFFFTPLFFTPLNSELFEFNKMMLVYVLTTIITGTWIIKMIRGKRLIFNRTPLDIPIVLFLISQILSTIFSIDQHTSLWGYYSRSNGGLLSLISYLLLYYALVSNYDFEQAKKFIKAALLGGLAVSLYAIPEHFGVSPSCILLSHTFSADCWVQDVQARVFATLGQPNWLAAYLEMLIFPALYFALTAKTRSQTIFYFLLTISNYAAFTFTYSRGASVGIMFAVVVFLTLQLFPFKNWWQLLRAFLWGWILEVVYRLIFDRKIFLQHLSTKPYLKSLTVVLVIFILVNLFFGSALTGDFRLLQKGTSPSRPGITQTAPVGTQLENGGTESGQIRLIVWKGAWEIFRHYPVFGSGVETFAYSYYNFRPVEHNLVSEWDFLYNKAHNEYLNYLATTGIVGFLSYMLMIGVFIWWSLKQVMNYGLRVMRKKLITHHSLLITSILASYIAYLVQDFFGFSVVIVSLFFFTFPAFVFLAADAVYPLNLKVNRRNLLTGYFITFRSALHKTRTGWWLFQILITALVITLNFFKFNFWFIYLLLLVDFCLIPTPALKRFLQRKNLLTVIMILVIFVLTSQLLIFWWADKLYKDGQDANDAGSPGRSFNILFDAVALNPDEPLYKAELGNAAAGSAVSLVEEDATTSAILKLQAAGETAKALAASPANTSIWRTAIRTYYDLSIIDPSFEQKTIEAVDQTIKLAPTDPKLYYNKALILETNNQLEAEVVSLQQAIELKPNYLEAVSKLGEVYLQMGDLPGAKSQFEHVLRLIPGDPGVLDKLQQIATASTKKK